MADKNLANNWLAVQQFFSLGENGSRGVGLPNDWAVQIVRQVGNYDEIFNKNLGPD
jgi:general L-amino acid transport system substrate-binding protein